MAAHFMGASWGLAKRPPRSKRGCEVRTVQTFRTPGTRVDARRRMVRKGSPVRVRSWAWLLYSGFHTGATPLRDDLRLAPERKGGVGTRDQARTRRADRAPSDAGDAAVQTTTPRAESRSARTCRPRSPPRPSRAASQARTLGRRRTRSPGGGARWSADR